MNNGTVKRVNSDKGFGFISNDNGGEDVFRLRDIRLLPRDRLSRMLRAANVRAA